MNIGQTVRLKSFTELIESGWSIMRGELVPPYWKEPCGISPKSVMLGCYVIIIDIRQDTPMPYHVQRTGMPDKLWVPGSMIKQ